VRIATWNLEQAQPSSAAGQLQARVMADVAADMWIVTETPTRFPLANFAAAPGTPMIGTKPARFTTIAARELTPLVLPEVPTGAAALVGQPGERWLVVGVCMPWRAGAPTLPPGAAPEGATGPQQWQHVLARLDAGMTRLRALHPDVPVLLAGDFNQTLTGHLVGSARGRIELEHLLAKHGLTAYTINSPAASPDCNSVDHLCGPARYHSLTSWMPPTAPGRRTACSDHGGYAIDFQTPA
jgi:hypothetical protein